MYRYPWITFLLLPVLAFVQESKGHYHNANNLIVDLFDNYTHKLRPRINFSHPVEVEIEFTMNSISNLDEVNQILYTNGYIGAYWKDEFLRWDPQNYGGIDHIVIPADHVWLPDIGVSNSVGAFFDQKFIDFRINLHHDGSIGWTFGGVLSTSCSLDLTFFPFDKQKCDIVMEIWSYIREDVDLINGTNGIVIQHFSANGIWDYVGSSVEVYHFNHDIHVTEQFPRIIFTMYLKRKPLYYLNAIVYPCIMLLVVALAVFWLPPDSGEKIGLGITVALSFTVFQIVINGLTPATSDYSPILGIFVLYISGFTAFSTFVSIIVYYFHFKKTKTGVPRCVRIFLFRYVAAVLCMRSGIPHWSNDTEDYREGEEGHEIMIEELNKQDFEKKKVRNDESLEKLSKIEHHLKMLRRHIKEKEKDDLIMADWKAVASVIDRFFFWLVFISSMIGVISFLTKEDDSYD